MTDSGSNTFTMNESYNNLNLGSFTLTIDVKDSSGAIKVSTTRIIMLNDPCDDTDLITLDTDYLNSFADSTHTLFNPMSKTWTPA